MFELPGNFNIFSSRVASALVPLLWFASCGIKSSVAIKTAGGGVTGVTIAKIRPIEAKPSDIVTIEGSNFSTAKNLRARFTLSDGKTTDVPITITDSSKATFVLPDGVGLGLKSMTIMQGASKEVASFRLVANTADNTLPIMTADASTICSDVKYIDRNGDEQTGTKNCSGTTADLSNLTAANIRSGVTINGVTGTVTPSPGNCSADGATGCVTTAAFKAADMSNVSAGNIKLGVTIAGQAGSVTPSPANCNTAGQQSCVATGTYYAGTICGADGSNCFLPSYSVPGFQTKKAVDVSTIDSSKMLSTLTVSGITGNITSRGSWNLTASFPGSGYYTGASNTPSSSTIATGTTIVGVAGEATLAPSNCNTAGQQSCVATGTYYAGTACTSNSSACYLPTYFPNTQPLKAISYDSISSNAANILSGTTIAGVAGTLTSPDPWDLRAGITAAGVSGQLKTNCRNGGSTLTFGMGAIRSATVANASDTLTVTSHGYQTGTVVWIDYTTQPTGLSLSTNYFVSKIDDNSFKLATTAANAFNATPVAIDITADGSGVIVWQTGQTAKAVTAVDTTNDTLTVTGHGYASTQVVRVSFTTNPGGLSSTTTYYVIVVDASTIKLATSPANATAGTAIDITSVGAGGYVYPLVTGTLSVTDTIDDRNNYGAILTSHPWSSNNNFCGGVEASAGDSNVWKDVTSGGGCASNPSGCRMKDKISGLEWTKTQSTSMTWGKAMDLCNGLTYDSVTGWRLPTQKELMDAYNHGIRSAVSSNWIAQSEADANNYFWSASSRSSSPDIAWNVHLANGNTNYNTKNITYQVVCVR